MKTMNTNVVTLPWIPILGPKLRKLYRQHGIKTIFKSGSNLQNILCNHKSKLPPNSMPGVYKIPCLCKTATYTGETKKRISSRMTQHKNDIRKHNWNASGAALHASECEFDFDWDNVKTLAIEHDYRKRKIREALEIRCQNTGPIKSLLTNRNCGQLMNSESWNSFFGKWRQRKPKLQRWRDFEH